MATPAIRGGEDGAMRRGRTDGTWLVDVERHRPLDLWPDRPADTVATGLRTPPGVLIRSRARSAASARGATRGAPEAQQVRDRWPVVRHRREALERRLERRPHRLAARLPANQAPTARMPSSPARSRRRSTTDQGARQARRARRLALYQAVQALHAQGVSTRPMATRLQLRRTTVRRARRTTVFPERAQPRRERRLDPSGADRHQRWEAGGHPGVARWREIPALGCSGTRRMVSTGGVRRRALERRRPSAQGRRTAWPTAPAMPLLPAAAAGEDDRRPAPRPLVWRL
jgi:hypothetical protein